MAFENEEDYLDKLLKSITSENNEDSGEDLSSTDSEMQMPETFDNPQTEDRDAAEEMLFPPEESAVTREEFPEQEPAVKDDEEEMNLMAALFDNETAATWENAADEETAGMDAMKPEESDIIPQDFIPEEMTADTLSEEETADVPEDDAEVDEYIRSLLADDDEMLSEKKDDEPMDILQTEDTGRGADENDEEDVNELLGRLDGMFDDIEENEENADTNETEEMQTQEPEKTNDPEPEEFDYSALQVDDELKELLGVESADELADIPADGEGLSDDELAKLAGMDEIYNEFISDNADTENTPELSAAESEITEPQEKNDAETAKTGFFARLASLFHNKKQKEPKSPVRNENQEVLNELFDENGELLDDDKKAKKKGLFSGKSRKKPQEVETALEETAASAEIGNLAEIDALIPTEETAGKKKKEKKPKKEKPEKNKKEKKEKKPKKPKKPKVKKEKPPVNPADLISIKPAVIIIMAVVVAGITGYVYFFVTSFNYNQATDQATYYMVEKKYTSAYRAISGVEMKSEEDIALKEQITTVMYVQHYYDAYERYLKVDLQFEALDSLIRGISAYDMYYNDAVELGITADFENVKANLVNALSHYGITESMARSYGAITDYAQYQYILEGYGGISNDSNN